jgi:phasin family protein
MEINMAKTNMPFEMDMTKMMSGFKLPMVEMQQIMAISQKNIEAMTAANQVAAEGWQTLWRRNTEIASTAMEEASSLMNELTAAGTPEDKLARQIELVKSAYEKAMANAKELSELAAKSNEEAAELIAERVSDSLEEIKAVTKKVAKKAA